MNLRRIAWLAKKELAHILRDKMVMRIAIGLPLVQLLLIGFAADLDVNNIRTAFCDEDHTVASRALARHLENSGYFYLVPTPPDHRRVQAMLDDGQVKVAVIVPRGYDADLAAGRQAQVGVVLDGSDATTARIAAGYLESALGQEGMRLAVRRLAMAGRHVDLPPVLLRPAIWYNPALLSRDYMVPGVVGMIVLVLTLSLSTVSIVRERETGTLERLIMAPITPTELMVGKMVPYFGLALFIAGMVLGLAVALFHIPIRGSVLFLYAAVVLFAVNTLGLGLFMSSLARTQQQAILTNVFVIMPSILMSGFIAPIHNMPRALQFFTYAIPLRYFLVIVRGVCLKGLTPYEVWPQIAALVALTVVVVAAGSIALRRGLG